MPLWEYDPKAKLWVWFPGMLTGQTNVIVYALEVENFPATVTVPPASVPIPVPGLPVVVGVMVSVTVALPLMAAPGVL